MISEIFHWAIQYSDEDWAALVAFALLSPLILAAKFILSFYDGFGWLRSKPTVIEWRLP